MGNLICVGDENPDFLGSGLMRIVRVILGVNAVLQYADDYLQRFARPRPLLGRGLPAASRGMTRHSRRVTAACSAIWVSTVRPAGDPADGFLPGHSSSAVSNCGSCRGTFKIFINPPRRLYYEWGSLKRDFL